MLFATPLPVAGTLFMHFVYKRFYNLFCIYMINLTAVYGVHLDSDIQ